MCGISGIYHGGETVDAAPRLERMLDRVAHRGPDDRGSVDLGKAHLGHLRLSILDLSDRARQPMRSYCGRFTIVFNGEIYNFRELRVPLEEAGVELDSTGDTRVLLEHLARFGVAATLPLLEGFFGFALWDAADGTLTLARDRHGIKPLYYAWSPRGELRFSSEIKSLADDDPAPEPALVGAALLGLGCTWEERTMFRGVSAVRPGEYLVLRAGRIVERERFFALQQFVSRDLSEELERAPGAEVEARVAAALEQSLEYRMISDAPVACFVSGGLDSNLIASMAVERNPDLRLYHADVRTNSERDAAQALAAHLGSELRTVEVTPQDFLDHVPVVTWHNDIPLIYHFNSIPFFLVSELASRDGIKVILTGEGSDEYFVGYPRIALEPLLNAVDALRARLQGALHAAAPKAGGLFWPRRDQEPLTQLRELLFRAQPALVQEECERVYSFVRSGRAKRVQTRSLALVLDHLGTLLHRNDRLGMAWGLESRFPFLGHALARVALNLPARYKIRKTLRFYDWRHPFVVDKWMVRRLAERRLPRALAFRPKKGFPVSIPQRLRVEPTLFEGGFVQDWFGLSRQALARLLPRASRLWATRLMLLDCWGRLFFGGQDVESVRSHLRSHVRLEP